jgi:hypothetical protein
MTKPKKSYRYVVVETFKPASTAGRHGSVHTRPIRGQGFSTRLYVQGPAGLKKHPVGTRFLIRVTLSSYKGGTKYLKSHYSWDYEVLKQPRRKPHNVGGRR